MTRCKRCGCRTRGTEMCVKYDRELEWLNTPEYFCLHCGKHLPGATKNQYCAICVKNGFINKENREMGMHRKSKESCGECGGRLTRRGYCYKCKEWPGRENGTVRVTEPCAADTIHARPAPVVAEETKDACDALVMVKLLHPDAKVPEYKTAGAAGFDLCAVTSASIQPGESESFKLGIAFAIPDGYEIQIRPRSGLSFKTPLMAKNTIGTIDSDYRGEVAFALFNSGKAPVLIAAGDRICQGVLAKVPRAGFMLVDELPATVRGKGGFGSTGR